MLSDQLLLCIQIMEYIYISIDLLFFHMYSFHKSRRGSRGGEMGEFPPPFSEPSSFFFFRIPQTTQPGFGSMTLLQKFTPPPFQNPESAPAVRCNIRYLICKGFTMVGLSLFTLPSAPPCSPRLLV